MNEQHNQSSQELVPIETVLDDMYSDGYPALAAREYYYMNYADDAERAMMDQEDRRNDIFVRTVWLAYIAFILAAILIGIFTK